MIKHLSALYISMYVGLNGKRPNILGEKSGVMLGLELP
jgi:hypothetical protein